VDRSIFSGGEFITLWRLGPPFGPWIARLSAEDIRQPYQESLASQDSQRNMVASQHINEAVKLS
jgi:hypothetical protein